MGFLISVVGVESLPNHLFTHTNAQHTTAICFSKDQQGQHEFRVGDGVHDGKYWRTGIVDALKFIGDRFH